MSNKKLRAQLNTSFTATHHIESPWRRSKRAANYSFSEVPQPQLAVSQLPNYSRITSGGGESRTLQQSLRATGAQSSNNQSFLGSSDVTKLPKYKPSTSLAEENLVRNFNKFQKLETHDLPTSEPQRIELPLFFNTPNRNNKLRPRTFKSQDRTANNADSHVYVRSVRRLRDYQLLAFACRRAGKTRDEGRSYYSMGVLCDNIGKFRDAITHYKRFLQVCRSIGDVHGEALAYNCIGVDYQLLAEEDAQFYRESIEYHTKHEELADVNGKFLACINLGLCYDRLQDYKNAMQHYQNALRHSIKMANLVGQTIAIGNIGRIGTKGLHQNKEKMKVFVEKYLKLSNELKDKKGEIKAFVKMGTLNLQGGEFEKGREHFLRALEMAEEGGADEQRSFSLAKCGFAVANVENNFEDYALNYEEEVNKYSPQKMQKY